MRWTSAIRTFAFLVLLAGSWVGPTPAASAQQEHRVRSGDTLGGIALRYGVSVADLRRWNGLRDDRIRIDQVLLVRAPRGGGAPARRQEATGGSRTHTVASGDTLGGIALRYGVSVADLRRWNNLPDDRIRAGQELRVHARATASAPAPPQRVPGRGNFIRQEIIVRSGDTGLAIARRHQATLADLSRWNPGVNLDRLRIGQRLYVVVDAGPPGSRGDPNRGRLIGGVALESSPGIRVREPARSFGTQTTVHAVRDAYARVQARDQDAPTVMVGDLSLQQGGPIRGHRSHQNGRDADIAYFRLDDGHFLPLRVTTPEELDVRRQWYLFRTWILRGEVEYIFMDFALQAPLYAYVQARGATEEQLEAWFQYPHVGHRRGLIRHEPGHATHFHIRFVAR